MNFTLDDSSPQLSYTPNAWAVQPPSDTQTTEFFQDTYHVAQANGARLNMSIDGSAFYLYGSKGPGHGNFSVQYDGSIIFLSAYAEQTSFQQVLFSHTFAPDSEAPHFVSLTALLSGSNVRGPWLDVDYVTFTSPSSSSTSPTTNVGGIVLPTAVPPWISEVSQTSTSTLGSSATSGSPTPSALSSSSTPNSPSKVPITLAALFGSILGLLLLGVVGYLILRRIYDSRRAKERNFRFGNSSVVAPPSIATRTGSTALLSLGATGTDNTSSGSGKMNNTHAITPPSSPGFGNVASGAGIDSEGDGKAGSTASSSAVSPAPPAQGTSSSTPFAFLSTAPLSFNIGSRRHKGDADSLRTDFLQV